MPFGKDRASSSEAVTHGDGDGDLPKHKHDGAIWGQGEKVAYEVTDAECHIHCEDDGELRFVGTCSLG